MSDHVRKIAIHIRSSKKTGDSHAHKKVKAHLHTHTHDEARRKVAHEAREQLHAKHRLHKALHTVTMSVPLPPTTHVTVPTPPPAKLTKEKEEEVNKTHPIEITVARSSASLPKKTPFTIPKKPAQVEGVSMYGLKVAYFCMEVGLESAIPTYAGGLGILAGDMLKSCADLGVAAIGVTLLHRKGFFRQALDQSGWQIENPEIWDPSEKLTRLPFQVSLTLEGRPIAVGAWLYKIPGRKGEALPVIFLDTDLPENTDEDRRITDGLYDGDLRMRLRQEAVLGIAGMRMLTAIGATNLEKYHMNEGHSALLTLELYRHFAGSEEPVEEVRRRAVFTTHTPLATGHDKFGDQLVFATLGRSYIPEAIAGLVFESGVLNMTRLGLNFSKYVNGVAKRHGEVAREIFPGYQIESITNGVNAREWTSPPFARLFDKYLPTWRRDPYSLRSALAIPEEEMWEAHEEAKRELFAYIGMKHRVKFDMDALTIGFARRAASYKRGNMLFTDVERLKRIAESTPAGLQIIYAGKAHPADRDGKLVIQSIIENMRHVGTNIRCVYLEDYDMEMAKLLVSGVDVWLNTPERPLEASGTSGMKAALNGIPQLSILDGWWLEGHIENATGWSIGAHPGALHEGSEHEDVEDMYAKLEHVIIPKFTNERGAWVHMMRQTIAINGSFFNTHRMVEEYVSNAYFH